MPPKRKKPDKDLTKPVGQSLLSPLDIRKMRERLGMYQRELAIALNVRRSTVCYWEAGSRSISHEHASMLYQMHKRAMESGMRPMTVRDPRKRLLGDTPL